MLAIIRRFYVLSNKLDRAFKLFHKATSPNFCLIRLLSFVLLLSLGQSAFSINASQAGKGTLHFEHNLPFAGQNIDATTRNSKKSCNQCLGISWLAYHETPIVSKQASQLKSPDPSDDGISRLSLWSILAASFIALVFASFIPIWGAIALGIISFIGTSFVRIKSKGIERRKGMRILAIILGVYAAIVTLVGIAALIIN